MGIRRELCLQINLAAIRFKHFEALVGLFLVASGSLGSVLFDAWLRAQKLNCFLLED